jgi:nucleoside-diphosphate-sugar epimerase
MTWTVMGSGGFIGGRLVSELRSSGELVNTPARNQKNLYQMQLGHVIYAVGLTSDFRSRPYDTVEAHVCKLIEFFKHAKFESFLYLSSTRVYARSFSGNEVSQLSVTSSDPSDLYNLSKLLGESICLQDARSRIRVARLSNVVGSDDINSENFLPSLVREARTGYIRLQTTLESAKDYVHIDDVVRLLICIAESGRHRIYNVASGLQTTHQQLIDQLVKQTGCLVEVIPSAQTLSFPQIDIRRISEEFNFNPQPPINLLSEYFTKII